ncbi:hypothetical protein ACXYMO_15735 [Arenibacterium sp. CAU 1754]
MTEITVSWQKMAQDIRALLDQKKFDRARKLARAAAQKWPRIPGPFALLARISLAEGKIKQARAHFDKSRALGLSGTRAHRLGLNIALDGGDAEAVLEHAAPLLDAEVKLTVSECLGIAHSHDALERWNNDPVFWKRLIDMTSPSHRLIHARYTTLFLSRPEEEWPATLESAVFGPDGGPAHAVAFKQLHSAFGNLSPAIAVLARRAADTWPDDPTVKGLMHILRPQTSSPAPDDTAGPGSRAAQLNAVLEDWRATSPDPKVFNALKTQLTPDVLQRDLLRNDPEKEVQVSPVGPSDLVMIVIAGLGDLHRFPFSLIDAYLAASGITGLYLRDGKRTLCLGGIHQIADSYDGTVAGLREILGQIPGANRLAIMSTSAGGMAAGNFGCDLEAETLLMFSPPTNVSPAFLNAMNDSRGRIVQKRLANIEPRDLLDLRARFQASAHVPKTLITYSANRREDRLHAENLGDLDGVELKPLSDTNQHLVLPDYITDNSFLPLLRALV